MAHGVDTPTDLLISLSLMTANVAARSHFLVYCLSNQISIFFNVIQILAYVTLLLPFPRATICKIAISNFVTD